MGYFHKIIKDLALETAISRAKWGILGDLCCVIETNQAHTGIARA